jgi:copper/silver efflux system protein
MLAKMTTTWGPGMISSEDARWSPISPLPFGNGRATWKRSRPWKVSCGRIRRTAAELPAGYALLPVGSFQNQIEANQRLLSHHPHRHLVNLC